MPEETTVTTQDSGAVPSSDTAVPQTTPAADVDANGLFERSLLTNDIETELPAANEGDAVKGNPDSSSKEEEEGGAGKESAVPEKYELVMPEGWKLDEEGLSELTPIMQGLKATNEQVQAVADLYIKRFTAAREAQLAADSEMLAAWQNEIKTDPEIGGAALKENLAVVSKVLSKYAGPEFVEYMDKSNLGNYPPFVKAMVKMAKDLSDDSFITGGRGGGTGGDPMKEAANLIYGKI